MSLKLGNRVTELDIRNWLDQNDFDGKSAGINGLELHAIQRPGWVQLYRFQLKARPSRKKSSEPTDFGSSPRLTKFGVVLDDERIRNQRQKTRIWLYDSEHERAQQLSALSDGMLTCRTGQNGSFLGLITFLFLLSLIAVLASLLG